MISSLRARHVIVALTVLVLGGLTGLGCVGPAVGPERIHSFALTAVIREDRTVAVREVIDYDFGAESRHGIVRLIPSDGGAPQRVTVESATAPDDVRISSVGNDTEVRIGSPDEEVTGRHRYVVSYVLDATIVGDQFALDAIGATSEVPLTHARVTVLGATLASTRCTVGSPGSRDECDLVDDGGAYRVSEDRLGDHEGITVDGRITATHAAEMPEPAPFEDRDGSARLTWAGIVLALGALVALVTFVVCRQVGRNEVAGGGATEAAFADGSPTFGARRVADVDMGELAGLEFVPPRDVEPWQASVIARETIDDRTIGAWFSGLAAHDVIALEKEGSGVVLRPGPAAAAADATTAPILNRALGGRGEISLGRYDPAFAGAWKEAGAAIDGWTVGSGTFRRRPPRYGQGGCLTGVAALVPFLVIGAISATSDLGGGLRTAFAAVALALVVPAGVALVAYRRLTRALTARGSAIALRTESFRRFLHDSEAQHVEWAWEHGLLREYSAWAVALGEADAWNAAMSASSVPPAEVSTTTGILAPAIYASSFSSATTAPSSSSSGGGGGGFSGGGSVGGGGGGGSTGSW